MARKFAYEAVLKIPISDFIVALEFVQKDRLLFILKKYCRSTAIDRWHTDPETGDIDWRFGDMVFVGKDCYEREFWSGLRDSLKRINKSKIKSRGCHLPKI